jgi:hypothetical protein
MTKSVSQRTDCFNCNKPILDHSEGQLHKCLKFLSAQCHSIKSHTEALANA